MIDKQVYEFINFYKELLRKVKEENFNPFEININELIKLSGDNILTNALIISLLAKIMKEKATFFQNQIIEKKENNQEKIKKLFKQVITEETGIKEEDISELLKEESILEKIKKPKKVPLKRISYSEFIEMSKQNIKEIIYEDTNYIEYSKHIFKQIQNGTFKIKSYKDFIGLMFCIYIYDIDIKDIKNFF